MKVFISVDMEGISGVVSGDECSGADKDYGMWRKTMTLEANAAIEGAFEAGATEVVVNDSHGGGRNLLPEELDPRAVLSRGQPLPAMIAPLDATYAAGMLIGYHAKRGTACAILDHTYSGKYHRILINGREFGEMGLAAAYAGHFGVPIVFVSGDDKLQAEARDFIPHAGSVVTKHATGQTNARCLSPQKARDLIRAGAREALSRLAEMKPFLVEKPITLDVEFATTSPVDQAVCLPVFERAGARAIRGVFPNMVELVRLATLMTRLVG
ncbi:MAG: M55 family metallopeptidase [Candidatus Sumerlaeota bacterium]|nr:M55 family metallopeptidase [Candidatus Sumerlaeota bacterium]